MMIFIKCVLFLLVERLACQILAKENDLIVKTKNGLVQGSKNLTVDRLKVYYSFRGIPYAQPPLEDLRFSSPVPVKNWTGVFNATKDGNICTQSLNAEGFEDCLFISVYTTNLNSSKLLPVMVWVYGGTFLTGSSRYSLYGPDYFLDNDVVIVSFNYRLGVFGFLSTQDEAAPGNWGIKDQILALKWVQDNIKNFGGDPKRVTVFGESAGSVSVSYLVQTHLAKGLFHGAIMESGVNLDLWGLSRNPRSTAFKLGSILGINTKDSNILLQKLRKINYKRLQTASTIKDFLLTVLTNPRDGLIFAPSEEPYFSTSAVFNKSHEKLNNGQFNRVPMIVGFNSQEGLLFEKVLKYLRLYLISYDVNDKRIIPVDMNVNSSSESIVASKIKEHYFGKDLIVLSQDKLIQYVTDDQFVRGINEAVRLMSKYTHVYYYRFSYRGRLGLGNKKEDRNLTGVSHGEDLNYLWRRDSDKTKPSQSDLLTRQRLIKLWTNFAKTLNPTPKQEKELQNITWTRATPQTQHYLDIGNNLTVKTNLTQYSIDWWQKLYSEYGHPPYDTY